MLKYDYWQWDAVLTAEQCALLINETKWEDAENGWDAAKIGDNELNLKIRKTDIVWHPNLSVAGCLCTMYATAANLLAGWDFDLIGNEQLQMSRYKSDGGFYDWHMDTGEPKDGLQRKLSVSILLNDDFEGGEFDFESQDNVLTKKGSILVFPSFLKHRVRPVTQGTRYSAVNWVQGAKFK
tara:strand:+ start:98 stop:640 length:543 start_codon:yes stop_codon:yes gene_type:complete